MLCLLIAGLAVAQAQPTPPVREQPSPPAATTTDPLVDLLDRQIGTLGRLLDDALDKGGQGEALRADFDNAVTRYEEALVALARRVPPGEAPPWRDRVAEVIRRERPTLVRARLERLALLLPTAPEQALAEGDLLLAALSGMGEVTGPDPALDPVRLQLVLAADSVPDRARVLSWSAQCAQQCVSAEARAAAQQARTGAGLDPLRTFANPATAPTSDEPRAPGDTPKPPTAGALLRWRAGLSWTTPATSVVVEGSPARKSPLDGQVAIAWAPSKAGCVEVGGGWDTWRAEGHPDGLGQRRLRVEAGWCPSLLVAHRGPLTAALRVVVGGGLAGGRVLLDGQADVPVFDAGLFVRLEVPLRVGPLEIGPRVGISPYGRGGLAFGRAALVGFGLAVGGGRQE